MISVVIPVHGKPDLLSQAIQSLRAHAGVPVEVIVVDDGSPDPGAIELASQGTTVIRSDRNRGFSAAVNLGMSHAAHRYCLVMNNDVLLSPGCVSHMLQTAKRGASIVGAKLLYPDLRIQHAGVYYRPELGLFDHRYRFMPGHTRKASLVDRWLVTGALMLIDRDVLDMVGPFDEDFFVAWEDIDLCLRVFEAGRWCCYDGRAQAVHLEGATRGNTDRNKVPKWLKKEQEGKELFFRKWAGYNFARWRWK